MEHKSLKEFFAQRFKLSKKTAVYLLAALLAVILLLATGNREDTAETASDASYSESDAMFSKNMTSQLEDIISKIDGVGDVSVMLTTRGSSEIVYAEDTQKDELDRKTETVIIGSKEALVRKIENPEITGVLIVCDGGDDIGVKEKVINAVSTVLNIPSNRVYVTNSSKERLQ